MLRTLPSSDGGEGPPGEVGGREGRTALEITLNLGYKRSHSHPWTISVVRNCPRPLGGAPQVSGETSLIWTSQELPVSGRRQRRLNLERNCPCLHQGSLLVSLIAPKSLRWWAGESQGWMCPMDIHHHSEEVDYASCHPGRLPTCLFISVSRPQSL